MGRAEPAKERTNKSMEILETMDDLEKRVYNNNKEVKE